MWGRSPLRVAHVADRSASRNNFALSDDSRVVESADGRERVSRLVRPHRWPFTWRAVKLGDESETPMQPRPCPGIAPSCDALPHREGMAK